MSRRDEVVEAMAEAMDAAYNPDRYPIMAAMFRDYADAGLDAALAVLQPAVPNEVEALEALPVGTVLLDQHEWAEETSHSDPARRWVCGTCGAEQTTPHEGDQP